MTADEAVALIVTALYFGSGVGLIVALVRF